MTIVDFMKAHGCRCFDSIDPDAVAFTIGDRRVTLHAGIDCHTTEIMMRGTGTRPRIARWRRPWLRARRLAMRKTGAPPKNWRMTYVRCRGCGAFAQTEGNLDGAW